jgi:aromatic ring-opening dioxygenase catalytic subunit (LigB family)
MLMPVLFLPHGGGPLPLLQDPSHAELIDFLRSVSKTIPHPKSLLVITAHWEESQPAITAQKNPELLFDYYGFPPEAYKIQYPAVGNPQLASVVADLLTSEGFTPKLEMQRGFDHGTFVPLKLLYPLGDIPVVQLSLIRNLDPAVHIHMGQSLTKLREQGVLIIGSGMSFHNMQAFFSPSLETTRKSEAFDYWLADLLTDPSTTEEQKIQQLTHWAKAPEARFSHPREEHLMPLMVCFGAATGSDSTEHVFNGLLFNTRISSFIWR